MKNHSVFIFANDLDSGKSLATFGIMQMIMKKKHYVAFFRPNIDWSLAPVQKINHIYAVNSSFKLKKLCGSILFSQNSKLYFFTIMGVKI